MAKKLTQTDIDANETVAVIFALDHCLSTPNRRRSVFASQFGIAAACSALKKFKDAAIEINKKNKTQAPRPRRGRTKTPEGCAGSGERPTGAASLKTNLLSCPGCTAPLRVDDDNTCPDCGKSFCNECRCPNCDSTSV